ncbi:hypothetical protein [Streptomyces sp. NPDC002587]
MPTARLVLSAGRAADAAAFGQAMVRAARYDKTATLRGGCGCGAWP